MASERGVKWNGFAPNFCSKFNHTSRMGTIMLPPRALGTMLTDVFFCFGSVGWLDSQSKFQMFTPFYGHHIGELMRSSNMAAQYQALLFCRCETLRRISQLWDNAYTLNLENCLLYLSSIISQFLDFIRCMIFVFIFYCVTIHILY